MQVDPAVLTAWAALAAVIVSPIVTYLVTRSQNRAAMASAERQVAATLEATRREIAASVVTTSRQKWIDDLRNTIAEFQACMNHLHVQQNTRMTEDWRANPKYDEAVLLRHRIALLTNPHEEDHKRLVALVSDRLVSNTLDDSVQSQRHIHQLTADITAVAQQILKREWERVKEGEPVTVPSLEPIPSQRTLKQ